MFPENCTSVFRTAACSRQQLTRQLVTARVQVIASTLPPHTSAAHFSEMCIWLQPWREANVYTVTGLPGRPPASPTSAAALERMRPVANDHRDGRGDAAESQEMCCGGGWSRVVKVRRLLSCVRVSSAPASITTRRRPSLHGWSRERWFKEQSRHTFEQREENINNADNPTKVVMPPVTSHAWRQSA